MATLDKVKLELGDIAPDFTATIQNPDGSTETVNLKQTLDSGQKVLLIFYPGDDTPGCTKQLCGIRDIYSEYSELGVTVWGVNHATEESHLKFIKKYSYQFGIIVDKEHEIREKYGAIKNMYGRLSTMRGAVLIDTNGKIIFKFWGQQDNQKIIDLLKNN